MADDLLKRMENNSNFEKQSKNIHTMSKKKKVHYNKTVQVTEPVYKKLRLYSFENNIVMGKIATKAISDYLSKHHV